MSWMLLAAVSGALAVCAGALGPHVLAARLGPDLVDVWETAVVYHLLHSVALLALALFGMSSGRSVRLPAGLFAAGIALFSGSLYLLALTGLGALGPLTPVGGVCLILGWLSLLALR